MIWRTVNNDPYICIFFCEKWTLCLLCLDKVLAVASQFIMKIHRLWNSNNVRAQFYAALWISPITAWHSLTFTNVFSAERYGELFCFSFNPNLDKELREKAWGFIDLKAEFSRMLIPSNLWHVTAANHEYRVSIWSNACSCSGSITMISFSTKFQRSVFEFTPSLTMTNKGRRLCFKYFKRYFWPHVVPKLYDFLSFMEHKLRNISFMFLQ